MVLGGGKGIIVPPPVPVLNCTRQLLSYWCSDRMIEIKTGFYFLLSL